MAKKSKSKSRQPTVVPASLEGPERANIGIKSSFATKNGVFVVASEITSPDGDSLSFPQVLSSRARLGENGVSQSLDISTLLENTASTSDRKWQNLVQKEAEWTNAQYKKKRKKLLELGKLSAADSSMQPHDQTKEHIVCELKSFEQYASSLGDLSDLVGAKRPPSAAES